MPKTVIDYSNTIIYKITCNDSSVHDTYVGHTTNFVQRKHAHKQSCINTKSANYKCKVYEIIRNNGGWLNWKMEIINFFNCSNQYEARQKEQEYFLLLNANLNSVEPFPPPKPLPIKPPKTIKVIYHCAGCNVDFDNLDKFTIHNQTKKHIIRMNLNDFMPNPGIKFSCDVCDFTCCKESDFMRHTRTGKHSKRINSNNIAQKNAQTITTYNCVCGKTYKHQSSLCNHRKSVCCQSHVDNEPESVIENSFVSESTEPPFDFSIMFELIKQNQEFKELIIEQNEKMFEQNKQIFDLARKFGNTNAAHLLCNNYNINEENC